MKKHTNPFYTNNEALVVLHALGTNPLQSYDLLEREADSSKIPTWPENVLSVVTTRVYENSEYYFETVIHLDCEGFQEVSALIGCEEAISVVKDYSSDYEMLSLQPSPCLKLMALVPKRTKKEDPVS